MIIAFNFIITSFTMKKQNTKFSYILVFEWLVAEVRSFIVLFLFTHQKPVIKITIIIIFTTSLFTSRSH